MDANKFEYNNNGYKESKEHSFEYNSDVDSGDDRGDYITILVKDKSVLPKGYHWEEKGREFSFNGMFYDIFSIEQTKEGWVIKAASDKEEAAIVANQHKVHDLNKETTSKTTSSKIRLNLILALFECPLFNNAIFCNYTLQKKKYPFLTTPILSRYSGLISHPPETV